MSPQAKELTYRLIDSHCGARLFYDVNLRKDSYTAPLVRELMARAQVVKLNEDEAAMIEAIGRLSELDRADCRLAVEGYFSTGRMVKEHIDHFRSMIA